MAKVRSKYNGLICTPHIYEEFRNDKVELYDYQKEIIVNEIEKSKENLERVKYTNEFVSRIGFLQTWKDKIVIRVFAVRVKIDRRKKKDRYQVEEMEIMTSIEGERYANVYSTRIANMCGWTIQIIFDSVNWPHWWDAPAYWHTWLYQDPDYMDDWYTKTWSVEDILKLKPDLKYSQIKESDNVIMYLAMYNECKGIEILRKLGYSKLLDNKNCQKRLNNNDKTFMKFLYKVATEKKDTSNGYNFYIEYYNKYGLDLTKWEKYSFIKDFKACWLGYCNPYACYYNQVRVKLSDVNRAAEYCWLKKETFRFYMDYLEMAKRVGHDIEDEYWRYPNDLRKAHAKLVTEEKNVKALNSQLKYDFLNEVLKDLKQYNGHFNGYDVFVTSDIKVIQQQCDTLYQCLIRNDYILQEIKQEKVLVFLWKDGVPSATAEVFYDGKVGQFYGDERDRDKCQATPEQWKALNEWLAQVKLEKRKADKTIRYYKGFHKKLEDGKFYTSFGDTTFEIGKTYETPFDDSQILSLGGSRCRATDKVFHFCDSIQEIKKHYSPTCYCIIEALGPVLEHNGALLSNKIKIVREVTEDELKSMLLEY